MSGGLLCRAAWATGSLRVRALAREAAARRYLASAATAGDSPATGVFAGQELPYVESVKFVDHDSFPKLPVYRVMDEDGRVRAGAILPALSVDTLKSMYTTMTRLQSMDDVFYDAQRQGRISFYMTNSGEEGIQIGSAAALTPEDVIFSQYREAGVLLWRGFTLQEFADQLFSNKDDLGKGRQMPVHYGVKRLNFVTISSPLGVKLPQAAGAGYALKVAKQKAVAVAYFGDGAASEGDFHAAMNFATTLQTQTLYLCRNNGYAISTPVKEQYHGDGIAGRGPAYGMRTLRVDGNDVLAVYNATVAAREHIVKNSAPVLLEAMSYRIGHHSTSDDSTRYRTAAEIEEWRELHNPVVRLRKFLVSKGIWSKDEDSALRASVRKDVLAALSVAEKKGPPAIADLSNDVYDQLPASLAEQQAAVEKFMHDHPEAYAHGH